MSVKTVENKSVEVKVFPETAVAHVRYVGPYKGDERLFAWVCLFGRCDCFCRN